MLCREPCTVVIQELSECLKGSYAIVGSCHATLVSEVGDLKLTMAQFDLPLPEITVDDFERVHTLYTCSSESDLIRLCSYVAVSLVCLISDMSSD